MNALWRHSVDVARDNGYVAIAAQAGTEETRKVLNDELGFKQVAEVSYADFTMPESDPRDSAYSGPVFADIAAKYPGGLSLHERRIPSNLYV